MVFHTLSLTVDRILMTFEPLQPYHLAVVEGRVSSSKPETKLPIASLSGGLPRRTDQNGRNQTNTEWNSDANSSEAGSTGISCDLSTEQMMF